MRRFGKRRRKNTKTVLTFQEHTEPLRCVVRNNSNGLFGGKGRDSISCKKKRLKMMSNEEETKKKCKRVDDEDRQKQKEQTFLDFGQSNFGSKICKICGMMYSPGKPEDEALHSAYCEKKSKPIAFRSKRIQFVVFENLSLDVQVWKVQGPLERTRKECKYIADKYVEVKRIMDVEMGFGQAGSSDSWTAYFYVKKHVIAGCVIVEKIQRAHKLLSKDSASLRVSNEVVPVRLGIVQLWVDKRYRRQGIAKSLIDSARTHTIYGSKVRKSECAMTQPTRDGRAFGECYFGADSLFVYE